jgi:hypothetical protein
MMPPAPLTVFWVHFKLPDIRVMKIIEYLLLNPVQVIRAVVLAVKVVRRLIRKDRTKEKPPGSGGLSV